MINISQGHEKSISIETLIKSFFLIPSKHLSQINLYANKEVLLKNFRDCGLNLKLEKNNIYLSRDRQIKCTFIEGDEKSSSFESLNRAIQDTSSNDILVTQPTTKDKFKLKKDIFAGHTDYFRKVLFSDTTMNFISDTEQILLLTDHIPIEMVPNSIKLKKSVSQIDISIRELKKFFNRKIDNVLISGINPHAGESGLISNSDDIIKNICEELSEKFQHIRFVGPIPSDTKYMMINDPKTTLQVFCHHDQALTYFKFKTGFLGVNTSFGLNFLRLSVDHGTACELYGKNLANPLGCYYVLKTAIEINERLKS